MTYGPLVSEPAASVDVERREAIAALRDERGAWIESLDSTPYLVVRYQRDAQIAGTLGRDR